MRPMHLAHRALLPAALAAALFGLSCGGGTSADAAGAADPGGAAADVPAVDPGPSGPPPLKVQIDRKATRPLFDNRQFHLETFRPIPCQAAAPCPAVVLVPPGLEAADTWFGDSAAALAAELGAVVVVYNPPGRGEGDQKTGGSEDFNGPRHAGLLTDVLQRTRGSAEVDENRVGVVAFGWGSATAASVLNTAQGTSSQLAAFFVDVEGPTSRCDVTAQWVADGSGADGDGTSNGRCNFCEGVTDTCAPAGEVGCACAPPDDPICGRRQMPFDCKYPHPADGGGPGVYTCRDDSPVIEAGAMTCPDDGWWNERELVRLAPTVAVSYLRLQFRYDHALPSRHAGREAYHMALTGPPGIYRQYNDHTPKEVLPPISACHTGCELDLPQGNGFGANPFHAEDPDYRPMELATLMREVLPTYVQRMLDR